MQYTTSYRLAFRSLRTTLFCNKQKLRCANILQENGKKMESHNFHKLAENLDAAAIFVVLINSVVLTV